MCKEEIACVKLRRVYQSGLHRNEVSADVHQSMLATKSYSRSLVDTDGCADQILL